MSTFPKEDAQAILTLRQQILANATVLFPTVVKGKRNSLFRWGHASADVLFDIAITAVHSNTSEAQATALSGASTTKYQAILTYGLIQKTKTAACGDFAGRIYGALESLFIVTAHELAEHKGKPVGFEDITKNEKNRSAGGGGFVDSGLFVAKKKKGLLGKK